MSYNPQYLQQDLSGGCTTPQPLAGDATAAIQQNTDAAPQMLPHSPRQTGRVQSACTTTGQYLTLLPAATAAAPLSPAADPLSLFDEDAVRLHHRLLSNQPTVVVWIGLKPNGRKDISQFLAWEEDEFIDLCRRGVSYHRDVYAMVQRGPRRARQSIEALTTLFLDIDPCEDIKRCPQKWAEGVAAATAAAASIAATVHGYGVTPYPVCACSGNGAYVFVPISPAHDLDAFGEPLKVFADWCATVIEGNHLVHLDRGCTSDFVRIARVIGTPNLKSQLPRRTYWLSPPGYDAQQRPILRYESSNMGQWIIDMAPRHSQSLPRDPLPKETTPRTDRALIDAVRQEAGARLADLFASFGYGSGDSALGSSADQRLPGNGGLFVDATAGVWQWFARDAGGDAIDAFGFLTADKDGREWDKSTFRRGPALRDAVRGLYEWLRERGVTLPEMRVLRPLTDLGNAERLVDRYGEDLRYCTDQKEWYVWDGIRWRADTMEVRRRAIDSARSIEGDAELVIGESAEDENLRRGIIAHAHRSEARERLKAAMDVAEACSLPSGQSVGVMRGDFDAGLYTLNCLNGILDLRTGELAPHSRDALMTRMTSAPYFAEARSEVWDAFLHDVTQGDAELMSYLQRVAGYALTASTTEERFFVIHGPTRSGKTTFIEALKAMMGDYSATSSFDTWVQHNHSGGPRSDIARLASVRLVTASEVNAGARLDEALVKQFTGGDTVTARHLYRGEFEFRPQAKLFLVANERPRVSGSPSDAIWSRLVEIPFGFVIPEGKRDPSVKSRLTDPHESGAAILAWAAAGTRAWFEGGLGVPPAAVATATDSYRAEVDTVGAFIEACCVADRAASAQLARVHAAWLEWANRSGESVSLTNRALSKELQNRGFVSGHGNAGAVIRGLRLLPANPAELCLPQSTAGADECHVGRP